MKKTALLCSLALTGMLSSCNTPTNDAQTDYTQFVDVFIGAADNGHTFPGATTPFGMIQTSPVTGAVGWRYCSDENVYKLGVVRLCVIGSLVA